MLDFGLLTGCMFDKVGKEMKKDITTLLAYGKLKQLINIEELHTNEKQYFVAMK